MTFDRFPRLRVWFAAWQLVVFLTTLFLIMAPVGSTLAAIDQGSDRNPLAQDESDPAADEKPSEDPPPEPVATESKPTEEPPVESQPTNVPIEAKSTEVPVESKPTEEPPGESKPTEEPVIDPNPAETFPTESVAAATPPSLPPDSGGPGSAPTTLIVTKGLCAGNQLDVYAARSLAELNGLCVTSSTDATFTYTYLDSGTTLTQGTIGSSTSFDVLPGSFSLQEQLPPGYTSPMVGCESDTIGEYPLFRPGNGSTITSHIDAGDTVTCYWYNVLIPPTRIVLIKGLCDDPGFNPYRATSAELAANCTQASGDATFTYQEMYTGYPDELTLTQSTSGSTTTFVVPAGNFSLREDIPAGFGEPVVSCHIARINWTILPNMNVDTIQGHIDLGDTYTCQWYNVTLGSTSHLTVRSWDCPPGYDHLSPMANPMRDCTQPLDGVEFQVEGIDTGASGSGVTGENTPGVVAFLDLEPGEYTVTEFLPTGYATSFVWTCTGVGIPASPTMPIVTGVAITITTVAGWNTTCHWFNVQEPASLTVIKYSCGPSILRDWSLCPIFKGSQGFDLLQWTGDAWVSVGTGTTDKYGRYTWIDLTPGEYVLDELGRDWCQIASENMSAGDKAITVNPGEEAVVHVYNCAATPTTPPARVVNVLTLLPRDKWSPMP